MRRRRQAGQALIFAAAGLTVFMLAAGLAIDMGYLRYQRRRMQSAADSAAIAGASQFQEGYEGVSCAAYIDSSLNGFTDTSSLASCSVPPSNTGSAAVLVDCQPTVSATLFLTDCDPANPYVRVTVSENEPTFFMRIVGIPSESVSAQAIAILGPGRECMYALGSGGISAGGTPLGTSAANIQAEGCELLSAGSENFPLASHQVNSGGNGDSDGECDGSPCGNLISPAPQKIAAPADPLSYLQNEIPSLGAGSCFWNSTSIECTSGDYPNGITITGSQNNASVTFASGSGGTITPPGCPCAPGSPSLNVQFDSGGYTLEGNLTIAGSGAINGMVIGSGVTFYANGSASISINNGGDYSNLSNPIGSPNPYYIGEQVSFSAPTMNQPAPNAIPGVLYVQSSGDSTAAWITLGNGDALYTPGQLTDSSGNTCASCYVESTGQTNTASYMWGAIYAPSAALNVNGIGLSNGQWTGCSNYPRFTELVANSINVTNNINVAVDDCVDPAVQVQATQAIPDPIKAAVLVE